MDNLTRLDFIPAGVIKGEKRKLRRKHPQGNKTQAGGVYHHEHVHTHGAGLPPFLCKPAPSFFWRAEREADAANNRDSTGE
jgi:hypothetical protein